MLRAAASSARKRSRFFLLTLAGSIALSLGLSGCAGIVSPSNGEGTSNPGGTLSISNVQASGATNTSVQLNWTTNEASTSAIDYGTTSVYGVSTPVSSKMVTAHQMTLRRSGARYDLSFPRSFRDRQRYREQLGPDFFDDRRQQHSSVGADHISLGGCYAFRQGES